MPTKEYRNKRRVRTNNRRRRPYPVPLTPRCCMNAHLSRQHEPTARDHRRASRQQHRRAALRQLVHDALQLQAGEIDLDEFRQRTDVTLTCLEADKPESCGI